MCFPTHLPLYIPEALCRCCHWWGADAGKFGKYIGKVYQREVFQNRLDLSLENQLLDQSLVEGRCWKIWKGYWKSCVTWSERCFSKQAWLELVKQIMSLIKRGNVTFDKETHHMQSAIARLAISNHMTSNQELPTKGGTLGGGERTGRSQLM